MYVYRPDKWQAGLGIPGTPAYAEIKNWVSIAPSKPTARFNFRRGVFGEPFLEMSTDSNRGFSISILQSSPSVEMLRNLFLLQLTGIVGFPFSLIDKSSDSNFPNAKHQKTFSPVSWIVDEPQEPLNPQSTPWIFQIACASGGTLYF